MNKFVALALFALLISISPARAFDLSDGRSVAGPSIPTSGLIQVSGAEHARLRHEAAQQVRSLAARGSDAGALIDAIDAELDPIAREAQWSEWLDLLAASSELQAIEVAALAELEKTLPVAGIPHHEFPARSVTAYALAERASVLLARHARKARARDLAATPDELSTVLDSDPASSAFAAGLEAMERIAPESLARLVETRMARTTLSRAASTVLLKAAEINPDHRGLLIDIVDRGNVATARQALLMAATRDVPELREIAAVALGRSEIGGLALTIARQSRLHPDDFCWTLLGDPALGADAARMLADDSSRLLAEVSLRIHGAPELARLRMLLALRLRGSEASHGLLSTLAESPWLTEQQRREVRSWL